MATVGMKLFGAISCYLDAETLEDATPLARHLIGLNPDRETLAGLLAAGASLAPPVW